MSVLDTYVRGIMVTHDDFADVTNSLQSVDSQSSVVLVLHKFE